MKTRNRENIPLLGRISLFAFTSLGGNVDRSVNNGTGHMFSISMAKIIIGLGYFFLLKGKNLHSLNSITMIQIMK